VASNTLVSLSRLANDSGGRFTELTNDYSLGYARAQRDLTCVYSLGFYVKAGKEDRVQNVSVRVRRPGLRAIHPTKYIFRSKSKKRESLLRAAWIAPEMFQSGVVRAHLWPLRPTSKKAWYALLAVSFTVPLAERSGEEVHREFGATLHNGSRPVHRLSRRIKLQPDSPDVHSEPYITFLEALRLKPGRYTLTAVLADPSEADPHATKVEIELPEVPKKELFLVGPILGRPAGPNLVVMGKGFAGGSEIGSESSFEPLLIQQLSEPTDLVSLTQACFVGSKKRANKKRHSTVSISRSLQGEHGEIVGDLDPVSLTLEGYDEVHCQNLVDVIPGGSLPDGEYVFQARMRSGRGEPGAESDVRFAIGAASGPMDRAIDHGVVEQD